MRVLILTRPEVLAHAGGEAVQIRETAKALNHLNVQVDVSADMEPDCEDYHVVHLFNLTMVSETYLQARHVSLQGKPMVLSTIYHDWAEYEAHGRHGALGVINRAVPSVEARQRIKALAKACLTERRSAHLLQAVMGYRRQQGALLGMVRVVLPNSASEASVLERDFGSALPRVKIVPNGVDPAWSSQASPEAFAKLYGNRGFVLCVGRIDEVKNQTALIRALEGSSLELVFIGGLSPRQKTYCRTFLREVAAHPRVHYFGELSHDLVGSAMASARVHVLPSWLETCGLTSLEAAAVGCRIVTTDRGGPPDYFGDLAWYCQPNDQCSIRAAVISAWEAPLNPPVREHVLTSYTWDHAAELTLEGYESALSGRPVRGRRT